MREYTFQTCHKEQRNGASYLFPAAPRSYQMTHRLGSIIERLRRTYSDAFPKVAPFRLCVIVEPRNGASGYWSAAENSTTGPLFVVEIDTALDGNEEILAHELAHPIMRLLGVPTGQSVGQIDKRIGDEFTSTSHHPFIFDLLDSAGYGDDQRATFLTSAEDEIEKLRHADLSTPTYTAPPGQTWLALWYFNFYLLARERYDVIYSLHKQKAPGVAEKMDFVRDCWMAATRNKGVIKRSAPTECIRSFQSHLFNRLALEGRVAFQSRHDWAAWLFRRA